MTDPADTPDGPLDLRPDQRERLLDVLGAARDLGLLGPGAVEPALAHAAGFAPLLPAEARRAMDLGSGGGVPALVLACLRPDLDWLLVDAGRRRTEFLDRAIETLELGDRARTWTGRAELLPRELRAAFDLVTARGFGPPAVLAECAAPWLKVGGVAVVSEPPGGDPSRWPADGLVTLGLQLDTVVPGPPAYVRLRSIAPCPARYPRRTGVPAKRPLW